MGVNGEKMHMESPHTQGQRKLIKVLEDDVHKEGNKTGHVFIPGVEVSANYKIPNGTKGPNSNHMIMVDGVM